MDAVRGAPITITRIVLKNALKYKTKALATSLMRAPLLSRIYNESVQFNVRITMW